MAAEEYVSCREGYSLRISSLSVPNGACPRSCTDIFEMNQGQTKQVTVEII